MQHTPIAVIGVSAVFPGSTDVRGFWHDILAGRDLTSDVPPSHWLIDDYYDPDPKAPDKTYCKRGAFVPPVDFEPMAFGLPPSTMPATDTAQMLALVVAQKVLDDVGASFSSIDRDRASVILGVTSGQELLGSMVSRLQRPVWMKGLRDSGIGEAEASAICDRIADQYVPWQEASFPGLLGNVVAGRIANRLDLRGTNCVTDAACASSLSALSMGIHELQLGQSDLVVTGGVDTMNDILMYLCFSKTPALSPTGDCRPFSDAADGTLLGEGIGMLALRRLEDAERDNNRIYAVVQGVGSSSDGRSKSVYAPLSTGQARALRRAYDLAGYAPETVELLEAHGTATKAGDAAEFEGLAQVFSRSEDRTRPWCALGSVKSQIGHTKAAAGAAGMIKAVLALHHKVLPPTIKVEKPNPKLELDESAFYLNTEARPWIRSEDHPRRASVSSFGFGGSNFHIALEEYRGDHAADLLRSHDSELFLLSGDTGTAVADACATLKREVDKRGFVAASHGSHQRFRADAAARLSLVAHSEEELGKKLEQAQGMLRKAPDQPFSTPGGTHFQTGTATGKVALLFPGQGSQYIQMGAGLAMAFDEARGVWDWAAERTFDGLGVHEVVFPPPVFDDEARAAQGAQLTATEWAQPAIGVASLSVLRLLEQLEVQADCLAGHSFGEVTALHAAGAIDADTFLSIGRKRGELMRDAASQPGAMTAVSAPIEDVQPWIEEAEGVVFANHNHATQVVVSGTATAIEAFESRLKAQGVTAKRLNVATAFHSPLVAGASRELGQYLETLQVGAPQRDVFSNAEVTPYPADAAQVRARLAEQLARPVRFVDQIEAMWDRGVRTFVEVGPGTVLTNFVSRILKGREHAAIATDKRGRDGRESLQAAVGQLAVAGAEMNLAALWQRRSLEERPTHKPPMTIPINGANYGKPYPALPQATGASTAPASAEGARPSRSSGVRAKQADIAPASRPSNASTRTAASAPAAPKAPQPDARAASVSKGPPALAAGAPLSTASNGAQARTPPASTVAGATAPTTGPRNGPQASRPQPSSQLVQQPVQTMMTTDHETQNAWVAAYQETQRGMVEAQATYQRAMADSHMAFLRAVEGSFASLASVLSGGALVTQPASAAPAPSLPVPASSNVGAAAPEAPRPAQIASAGVVPEPAASALSVATSPSASPAEERPSESAPAAVPAPRQPAAASTPGVDLQQLLLDVVSDKTGYPVEMIGLDMELEADLGVDSIKRVEILSGMRERAPELPEVVAAEMASLRTLAEIIEYMKAQGVEASASAPQAEAAAAPGGSGVDLQQLLLDVVADKTGYPVEMIGLDMELEADLGVDSIKRVEILSAMRERTPDLPEVVASDMAALRTLAEIIDYMGRQGVGQAGAARTTPTQVPASGVRPEE